jgi:phosphate starvation-inducible membrane PsiE
MISLRIQSLKKGSFLLYMALRIAKLCIRVISYFTNYCVYHNKIYKAYYYVEQTLSMYIYNTYITKLITIQQSKVKFYN